MAREHFPIGLNGLSLPPLEKGRVGVGIALRIVRPSIAARDPLLTSPAPKSGVPDFGNYSWPKSETSDLGVGEERFNLIGICSKDPLLGLGRR